MAGINDYRESVITKDQESIRLYGLDELVKLINAVGVPTEAIKKANTSIGKIVIDEAKQTANFKKSTGRLLSTLRSANLRNRIVVRAGSAAVPYANPIHWGWFYDKRNFVKKNIKPNPFLSRALGYKREEIIETYYKNMQDLIDRNYVPLKKVKRK
jgi:hypothetical protein